MPPVKSGSTTPSGGSDDRLAFIAAATDAFSDAVPDIESLLGLVAEPSLVLTAKVLSEADKRALNGHVSGIFQRGSVAGPELVGWLRGIVSKTANRG